MPSTLHADRLWPAFAARVASLTDDQLSNLAQTDNGRLQLVAFVETPHGSSGVQRKRVRRVLAATASSRFNPVRVWWAGEFRPTPLENIFSGEPFENVQRPWLVRAAEALAEFYLRNWQWLWGIIAAFAIAALFKG